MIEIKISIRMQGDELPLIKEIKKVAEKHKVDVDNNFIYRTKIYKNIGRGKNEEEKKFVEK